MIANVDDRFSIRMEKHDGASLPGWVYGGFCLIINDAVIGDMEIRCTLSDLLFSFKVIRAALDSAVTCLDTERDRYKVFYALDSSVYGVEHIPYDIVKDLKLDLSSSMSGYELTPLEGLDNYKIFFLYLGETCRFVWAKDQPANEFKEVFDGYVETTAVKSCLDEAVLTLEGWQAD